MPPARGARKQVYVALDKKTDSRVAVDVFSNNVSMPSGLSVSAWEAHVLGNLGDHENIGQFIDHWEDDGTAVMVSRYWGGGRLSERIERCREAGEQLMIDQIIDFSAQIASGLAHIHERRILYRDLEPRTHFSTCAATFISSTSISPCRWTTTCRAISPGDQ